ncbi:MAG: hypothetical protein HOV80_29900 [Polyangiaceae bacterium]|nr:hypothetical protein [Polyangiaceae bacterium]
MTCAVETDEAAACLTTLSFASRVFPERHVWVETDLVGRTSLDLEDRLTETTWDNAVHRFKGLSEDRIVEVVGAWLSGSTVAEGSDDDTTG